MKNLVLLSFFAIIFLTACGDETTNPISEDKSLKLRFTDDYSTEQGWAILYSEDGNTVIKTVSFTGDSEVDFGDIEAERVTLTIVHTSLSGPRKAYYIDTYVSVTKGLWSFKGAGSSNIGSVVVNYNFPYNQYDHRIIGVETGGYGYSGDFEGSQFQSSEIQVKRLIEPGKISLYSTVYNLESGFGYYIWNPNLTFTNGILNQYSFNLVKPLTQYNLQINKPINYLSVGGSISNEEQNVWLFFNRANTGTVSNKILLPDSLAMLNYKSSFSFLSNDVSYGYYKISNNRPDIITLPDIYIDANYNEANNSFENITITGTADFIKCSWTNSNTTSDSVTIWNINTSKNVTSVKRIELPSEVSSQIPNYDVNTLTANGITVVDYNTTTSFDDFVNVFLKNNEGKTNLYSDYYYYSKR